MAIGAAPRGPGSLAWTIQIQPSPDLVARSWHWPQSRHGAFDLAVAALAIAAATCILDGRPFGGQRAESPICDGWLTYSVACRADSVLITVTDFSGPDSPDPDWPGPNGGAAQPKPVDSLVIGLRGSYRYCHMVVFHGFMAPIPTINILTSLFRDFGYIDFCRNGGRIPFAVQDFAFDPASVAGLLFAILGSLQIDTGANRASRTPAHLTFPNVSPGSIAFDWGRKTPEQLEWISSDRQHRYAPPSLNGHVLGIHGQQRLARQCAPPGRYLH